MPKRVLVGYGIDVDAVSGWLNTQDGSPANPTNISRGMFGATVGIDRLLKLWEKNNVKTTWFVPAHSIGSFPEQLGKVRDKGHEIALHGYTHELVSTLSEQQQRDVLEKVITDFTSKKPKGWTAPAWGTSKETIKLMEEFGIEYDHSFMHYDCQMYFVPDLSEKYVETYVANEASTWMTPMASLTPSTVVEVPANRHLDDWPPFQLSLKQARLMDMLILMLLSKCGRNSLVSSTGEYDTLVFPVGIHPQVSGKPQVISMHERIINYINSYEGVEWCSMEEMVTEFKSGRFGGAEVKGGAILS